MNEDLKEVPDVTECYRVIVPEGVGPIASFNKCIDRVLEVSHNLLMYLHMVFEISGKLTRSERVKNQLFDLTHPCSCFKVNRHNYD